MQSAMRPTEGFSEIYCEVQQICHCYVTNLLFKHEIKIKMKLPGSYFSFFITIHSAFVFVDSNSSSLIIGQN